MKSKPSEGQRSATNMCCPRALVMRWPMKLGKMAFQRHFGSFRFSGTPVIRLSKKTYYTCGWSGLDNNSPQRRFPHATIEPWSGAPAELSLGRSREGYPPGPPSTKVAGNMTASWARSQQVRIGALRLTDGSVIVAQAIKKPSKRIRENGNQKLEVREGAHLALGARRVARLATLLLSDPGTLSHHSCRPGGRSARPVRRRAQQEDPPRAPPAQPSARHVSG